MTVQVLFFARLRELAGVAKHEVTLDEGATLHDLRERLSRELPGIGDALGRFPAVVGGHVSPLTQRLNDGDEVAWIPPVAGGSSGVVLVALTREPIDGASLTRAVAHDPAGAVALFLGTVRDHEGDRRVESLEYEAYEPLAAERLRALAEEVAERWPEARVAVVHRLGPLALGEVSVGVAVATPHRAEAFDACRHLMERLKASVPIWKRSTGPEGSTWVEGKPYEE